VCDAIILAAGYSSRANTNKLVLLVDGITVIERVIRLLEHTCEMIIVVSGHFHEELVEILINYPNVRIVKNDHYDQGMFSSVQTGVSQMTNDFILIPGDYPWIQPKTIESIIRTEGDIVVPTYEGKKGHPIFIRKHLIKPLMEEVSTSNLKRFRDGQKVVYIPVDDEGILLDIDTIDEYHHILKKIERGTKN